MSFSKIIKALDDFENKEDELNVEIASCDWERWEAAKTTRCFLNWLSKKLLEKMQDVSLNRYTESEASFIENLSHAKGEVSQIYEIFEFIQQQRKETEVNDES